MDSLIIDFCCIKYTLFVLCVRLLYFIHHYQLSIQIKKFGWLEFFFLSSLFFYFILNIFLFNNYKNKYFSLQLKLKKNNNTMPISFVVCNFS